MLIAAASVSHISATLPFRPYLAITANGSAHVIWTESYPSSIWTNHYTAGSGWAGPSVIETGETSHMKKPQIGLSQNGDAIAIWQDTLRGQIQANRYINEPL